MKTNREVPHQSFEQAYSSWHRKTAVVLYIVMVKVYVDILK